MSTVQARDRTGAEIPVLDKQGRAAAFLYDTAVGNALRLPCKGNGQPRLPRGKNVRERRRVDGLKVWQQRRRGMEGVDTRHQRGTVDPERLTVAGIA